MVSFVQNQNFTVNSLYAEATEAVKLHIALSASSSKVISILGDIKFNARL
jgi:hypothetical protein